MVKARAGSPARAFPVRIGGVRYRIGERVTAALGTGEDRGHPPREAPITTLMDKAGTDTNVPRASRVPWRFRGGGTGRRRQSLSGHDDDQNRRPPRGLATGRPRGGP